MTTSIAAAVRKGWFWMLLHAAAVCAWRVAAHDFSYVLRNDSRLYVKLARHASLMEMLESIRTLGYPLALRGMEELCGGLRCVPWIQLALYAAAAVGLCAALERFGLSGWAAFAAASPLLYSPLVEHLASSIMTDIPAAALALATLSLLLLLAAGARPRALVWGGLGLSLLLTYQVRPAYVFLVVLVPAAGWALATALRAEGTSRPGEARPARAPRRRPGRLAAGLAALGLLPLLLWCGVRWQAVGQFGLVSFTGYNLIGIAGSMLTEEVVAELPAGDRVLARAMIEHRRLRELEPVDAGSPFEEWRKAFILNSWRIAVPIARGLWRGEDEDRLSAWAAESELPRDMAVDRRLTSLAVALIRERPGLYLVWLGRAWAAALRTSAAKAWLWVPAALALLGLAARGAFRRRSRRWQRGEGTSELPHRPGPALVRSAAYLGVAGGFYLLALGVTLLVEPPYWRYLSAAELLLPGALAAVAVELWRSAFA